MTTSSKEMTVRTLKTTTKLFIYWKGRTNHLIGSNPFHTVHRSVKLIPYLSNQTTILSLFYFDNRTHSVHFPTFFRKELNVFQQLKRTKSKLKRGL